MPAAKMFQSVAAHKMSEGKDGTVRGFQGLRQQITYADPDQIARSRISRWQQAAREAALRSHILGRRRRSANHPRRALR